MSVTLENFVKKGKYLVCVDSDGCAMDTMNIKHFRCFGPCFTDAWGIVENRDEVLKRWNDINLFEITRGINRFLGFGKLSAELFSDDEEVKAFNEWVNNAPVLSEGAVSAQYEKTGLPIYLKALNWSKAVNQNINKLDFKEKKAFSGALEGLRELHKNFDIAVVSSANYQAVKDEWEYCGLIDHIDVLTTQQDGSKAHCIETLLKKGYDKENVIMLGDAKGDLEAAKSNGVNFYPILVNREEECWLKAPKLLLEYQNTHKDIFSELEKEFYKNLGV
ncbi:MAG: HAD family hydrolase [Gammaproteobacteria bacterium]|nr:HAD family hydrolase [Gammaproteobacteria bacterium]